MKLLFEEFFGRVAKLSEGGSWNLKMIVTAINVFIVVGVIYFIIYSFITKRYVLLLTVLGFVIIAESAHFVRKSREIVLSKDIVKKNAGKNITNELINPGKSKNNLLLKSSKSKNNILLKSGNVKNNWLLKGNVGGKNGKFKGVVKSGEVRKVENKKIGGGKNNSLLGLNKNSGLLKK